MQSCLDINSDQFWSSCLISYCLYLITQYCRTCIGIPFSNLKQLHQSFKFYIHKQCNYIIREMLDQTQTIWNLLHHQHSPYNTTLFYNIVLTQYKIVQSTQTLQPHFQYEHKYNVCDKLSQKQHCTNHCLQHLLPCILPS